MKINLKDRKTLTLGLCLILVCVFTLTVAYSALSAVLTINGNARVSAADWDIYLNNPRVTSGSVTNNVPVIKTSSTLEFETTLNMPGDFYEFTVDVVNGGDIDAMIENVVKTPDLTAEQAKFLKYEVSYQNGESITTKQLLAKDTTMPIKVRVEYRKDLSNTDLPTGQVVLDLALTLEYVQSDGTGISVNNNGVLIPISADGSIEDIGTIVTIGSEQFYTIGTEGNNVKLLAMYNLHVGMTINTYTKDYYEIKNPTGIQDSSTGYDEEFIMFVGGVDFIDDWNVFWDETAAPIDYVLNGDNYRYVYSSASPLFKYLDNYSNYLNEVGVNIEETRLIKVSELINLGCVIESWSDTDCTNAFSWVISTNYWTGCNGSGDYIWSVRGYRSWGELSNMPANYYDAGNLYDQGVRPVIVISKDYFN